MQMNLHIATKEEMKKAWAFASNTRRRTYKSSIITVCSKDAKMLGIRAGMRYEDAKLVVPELRVLVYRGGQYVKN